MNVIKAVILAISTAFILKLFVFDFIIAQGHSMEPAIKDGTVLIVNRLSYGIRLPFVKEFIINWAIPKPGEVVVFYTPDGELAVKRCVMLTEFGGLHFEGDNGNASYDSRSYGPVYVSSIVGKVIGH
ncbi:MAG: signal peptidase I [Treponema sp.]|nr:signal peptidase I [Treponema sp.]MCL2272631.1 signal peptidase I [Treponema sp.]